MNGQIVELYSDGDLARMARKLRRWSLALWVLALGALAACIAMTASVTTANAERMELAVIAVSTLAGWTVIYGSHWVVKAGRRELGHAEMLRETERQRTEGVLTVTEEKIAIRNSIRARRVEVRGEQGVRRLLVCESRAGALAASRASVLYTANGYVAAYEVKL